MDIDIHQSGVNGKKHSSKWISARWDQVTVGPLYPGPQQAVFYVAAIDKKVELVTPAAGVIRSGKMELQVYFGTAAFTMPKVEGILAAKDLFDALLLVSRWELEAVFAINLVVKGNIGMCQSK